MTYASAFTPYETVLNDSRFKLVRWIDDIIKKREEKSKELGLFAKFFQEHPGMEHLAGVERGGTFILVYSSKNNHEVVADFPLP